MDNAEVCVLPVAGTPRKKEQIINSQQNRRDHLSADGLSYTNKKFVKPTAAGKRRVYVPEKPISPTPSQDEQFRRLEISEKLKMPQLEKLNRAK
jgi:hypothetical protein